jgi:uncharacterized membrane protein YgcG
MKKLLMIVFTLFVVLLQPQQVFAASDIIVKEHHVEIYVQTDGVYRFKHELDVNFSTPYYGIYVNIPQEYDMTWTLEDGSTVNRKYVFPLTNFDIVGPHEFERNREGVQLRLGQAGVYVSGDQQYTYSYQMKTKDLRLDGRQRFYLNILGDAWDMPTEKVSFTIYFPKDMSDYEIFFYSGRYGVNTQASIEYEVNGNIVTGYTTTSLNSREALTIDIELESGYFNYPVEFNYSIIGLLYGILLFGLLVFMYLKHGKDDPVVPTVQFEPPKGLSSAQVGYIYDGFTDTKDIISLIIDWAAHGYLTIEEVDKKTIKLTKIQDLPSETIAAEKVVFNDIFFNRDEVTTEQLKFKFHTTLTHAKSNLTRYFTGNKKRRIFGLKADALQVVFGLLLPSMFALYLGLSYFRVTYYGVEAVMFGAFVWGFGLIISLVTILTRRKLHTFKSSGRFLSLLGNLLLISLYVFAIFGVSILAEAEFFIVFVIAILYVIGLYFNSLMHKRTPLGLAYYNDILGLKNFIELAEKDRLEMLVAEDPSYFYHILPYAYVLNVTNTWSKKFESIAIEPPSWYIGPRPLNTVIFMSHFNRSLNTLASTMSAPPPSKGGKGGGSFGGGGGFSGGGFGGGGGGGWR